MEFFGSGGYFALNYQLVYKLPNNFSIQSRVGIAPLQLLNYERKFRPSFIAPFHLGIAKGTKHQIHFNVGFSVISYVQHNPTLDKNYRHVASNKFLMLGYHFQLNKKISFAASINPIYSKIEKWQIWPSLGINYFIN